MSSVYPIIIALAFNLFDIIVGIIGALKLKNLQSSKMRDGFFKKLGFVCCYILALLIDTKGAMIGLQISVKIVPIIVLYVVTTEIVSIIENICIINPDLLPDKLKSLFHVTKEKEEKEDGENEDQVG